MFTLLLARLVWFYIFLPRFSTTWQPVSLKWHRVWLLLLFLSTIVDAVTLHWISKSYLPLNVRAPLPLSFCTYSLAFCWQSFVYALVTCIIQLQKLFKQPCCFLCFACVCVCMCERAVRCSDKNCLTLKKEIYFWAFFPVVCSWFVCLFTRAFFFVLFALSTSHKCGVALCMWACTNAFVCIWVCVCVCVSAHSFRSVSCCSCELNFKLRLSSHCFAAVDVSASASAALPFCFA